MAERTELQEKIGLGEEEESEPHIGYKSEGGKVVESDPSTQEPEDQEKMVGDEIDFHSSNIRGKKHAQSNVWDDQFLHFSKYLRKEFFKDYNIKKMQEMNKENFFHLMLAIVAQVGSYVLLRMYIPDWWKWWAFPLFVFHIWLIQFGEIVHTRAHWPKLMTGSTYMDSFVDTVAIMLTGTSKETFRRRHIVAHYSDVGNLSRMFSDVWLPFVQFPATFYIFPHKLLLMFLDVELCKKESMSRRQLFTEMVMFYLYLAMMVCEVVYLDSYFLCVFHFSTSVVFNGAQVMGAMLAHSGVDKRNSFNSNGLFDWRTATGLFKVSVWFVDFFANGGLSNHGIHHAHTQLPLYMVNRNLRAINKFCLENYKNVRYNQILGHIQYEDILKKIPDPTYVDYVIQFLFMFLMLILAAVTIMGLPVPPPAMFEPLIIDYRFFFYNSKYEYYERIVNFWEVMEIQARKATLINPNAYFMLVYKRMSTFKAYLETHSRGENDWVPPSKEELRAKVCSDEIYDFNITATMDKLREQAEEEDEGDENKE